MSTGLLALLDDVAALVKVTATSLDDVTTQASAAGAKTAGIIIDDAAVTPKYVLGLSPQRELPIIWNITKASLKNKILFLMPAALILGYFLPWIIAPILACGGVYLCFEGYEKVHDALHKIKHKNKIKKKIETKLETITPEELEKKRTNSAIRTDFILSAEIMAISYSTISSSSIYIQIAALFVVAVGITLLVYGAVALIVKADDVGYHLAKDGNAPAVQSFGRGIVKSMPNFLKVLGTIGTVAMLWVGGGIIIHSIPFLHHSFETFVHMFHVHGFVKWLISASVSASFGLLIGFIAEKIYKTIIRLIPKTDTEEIA